MQAIIERFWARYHLHRDRPVLLGLSGGADSSALLAVLREAGLLVVAAHLDHGLRADSQADAQAVADLCQAWNVRLMMARTDVEDLAQRERLSIEDAARRARYRFLFAQAQACDAQAVLVAHTADDQVETVLMHLLAGSGLPGLGGMRPWALPNAWSDRIPLARPLLEVHRADTLACCARYGIAPLEDPSNREARFLRNRVRLELLPMLERYNPQVRRALLQISGLASDADEALTAWTQQALAGCARPLAGGWQVDADALAALPVAVQRRVLRMLLNALGVDGRECGFDGVEGLRRFTLQRGGSGAYPLSGRVQVRRAGEVLFLVPAGAAQQADFGLDEWPQVVRQPLDLPIPGICRLNGNWQVQADWVEDIPRAWQAAQGNRDPWQAWIALGHTSDPLQIRVRRPGDVLEPLGLAGHHAKVSDLMSNHKVPQWARDGWPLVCLGESIVWVAGLRSAHAFRVQAHSERVALLTCRRTG